MGAAQANIDLYSFDYRMVDPRSLTEEQQAEYLEIIQEIEKLRKVNNLKTWFPDQGPYRRELYPKHMEFFALGAEKTERLFLAGNRCGKSVTAACEVAYHATGQYPHWWKGHRFTRGINIYVAGKTAKNTRDICQFKLLGEFDAPGTGTIPKSAMIGDPVSKPGVPKAHEMVYVRHESGDTSVIQFKSYDQGMEAFMGTEVDLAWEDEEPPEDVHSEVLTRLMTTDGLLLLTFTPLEGMTEVVSSYITSDLTPDDSRDHVAVVNCGWDDVPHLTEKQKARLLASTPPHLKEARSKGIPSLGAGAVFPVQRSEIEVEDFPLPDYWPRAYAIDPGWRRTAALWAALDRESDTMYLYSEHYGGQQPPQVHAEAVKARGAWMQGVADPAGVNQDDGSKMLDKYINLGLNLVPADKAVEAGIQDVWIRMVEGRLKVFKSLGNFWGEFGLYQRDKNGKIVKKNDHLMDCMRYLTRSIHEVASVRAVREFRRGSSGAGSNNRWVF